MATSKNSQIGIIGMGWVGSSVASSILHQGICKELLLNDLREGLAEGEAMDFNHGSSFYPTANVRSAEIKEMIDCVTEDMNEISVTADITRDRRNWRIKS